MRADQPSLTALPKGTFFYIYYMRGCQQDRRVSVKSSIAPETIATTKEAADLMMLPFRWQNYIG